MSTGKFEDVSYSFDYARLKLLMLNHTLDREVKTYNT
jgi:hypothetical protein